MVEGEYMPKKKIDEEMKRNPVEESAGRIAVNSPNMDSLLPDEGMLKPSNGNVLYRANTKPQSGVYAPDLISRKVDEQTIATALETLRKYKAGKANLEQRIIDAEQWWKMRHWKSINDHSNDSDPMPASGWLFNCVISKHADGIDAYPTFNCLPREVDDVEEAQRLSDILPVVIEQNGFEQVYSDELWQKLKGGTGVYGVFWDSSKLNGLGDISIQNIDLLNLFWQPGIKDIQKSKNIFHTELVDNDILAQRYPQLDGKLGGEKVNVSKYLYDDTVDTTDKTVVVDWYYHTEYGGKRVLQYCKFAAGTVLFATENEQGYENGWYEHGEYPFVFDALFPCEGTPCGFGYIDVCKDAQMYIDVMNQAIMKNALWGSSPRFFVRQDGAVNENEFADITKPFIHVNGNLSEDSIRQMNVNPLNQVYMQVLVNKVDELKETSGNRDVNNGGTSSGATAASAIAALQESSGKTSRDSTMSTYRAYKKVINLCVELIRQFYDMPRQFRIVGERGQERFVSYTNEKLKLQPQGMAFGVDMGMRKPVFDLDIRAQKNSPYSKLSQNELALQFFQFGFFNPQMTDQALACIDMMDFDGKDEVTQKISENGTMAQLLALYQQMALSLAQKYEPQMAEGLAANITGQNMMPSGGGDPATLTETTPEGGVKKSNTITDKAKSRAQEATQPR